MHAVTSWWLSSPACIHMMALFYVYYSMSVILSGANINLTYSAQQLILAHAEGRTASGDGRKICRPKWHITAPIKHPLLSML